MTAAGWGFLAVLFVVLVGSVWLGTRPSDVDSCEEKR